MDEVVFRRSKTTWVALLIGAIVGLALLISAAIPDTISTVDGKIVAMGPCSSVRWRQQRRDRTRVGERSPAGEPGGEPVPSPRGRPHPR